MITVGPVSVVAGQTINETDPDRFGGGSNKVQILNLSGLLLTVTIGDTQAPIPPFQAVTLATMFNVPLVVVTQATGYTARGSVTFYWLLEKEQSPVRDGPQTAALSNYTAGNVTGPTTSAVPVRTIPLTGVPFLATTAIITFNYTQDLSNNDTSPITVTGDQSGKTLYSVPLSN
ncbi:MAG: hypothetical protein KGI98_17500, partial [Euryarchaeota archaeon]|nr:hypothetical protein [Euryarchaeota archaeon]